MNAGWLALALALVVLGIGGYTAYVLTRRRKLEDRIRELESGSDPSV